MTETFTCHKKPAVNMATASNRTDINFIYDKTKQITMREFFDLYGTKLPQLVVITEGHNNVEACEDLSSDEVYRIHTFSKQYRVIAETEDNENTHLSIPVQTASKFFVVQESGIENLPKTLPEILENNDYPIKVLKDSTAKTALTLQQGYTEFYLVGNCLCEGICRLLKEPVYTALSSVMKCAIITGIEGKSQEEFREQLRDFSNFISQENIKFDLTAGSKGTKLIPDPPFTGAGLAQRNSSYCFIECSSEEPWYTEMDDIQSQPGQLKRNEAMEITDKEKCVNIKILDNTKSTRVDLQSSVTSEAKNICASTDKEKTDSHDRKLRRQPPPSVHQVNAHPTDQERYESEEECDVQEKKESTRHPPVLPSRVSARPADRSRQMHELEHEGYDVQESRTFTIQPLCVPTRIRANFQDKDRYEPIGEGNQESSRQPPGKPLAKAGDSYIQEDLESMSIGDVKSRLEQLGIRKKVINEFEKGRIDGKTLKNPSLSDDILRKEYKLKHIEIIKLRQYIDTGHMPK